MRPQLLAIFICLMKGYLSNTNLGSVMKNEKYREYPQMFGKEK